jgi:hypothetical protein
VLLSAAILVAAWFIASLPEKPAEKIAIEDQSDEGLLAQRRMLHENIADVERMRQSGEMPPEAYLARLKELRAEQADNEAALKKAGVKIRAETRSVLIAADLYGDRQGDYRQIVIIENKLPEGLSLREVYKLCLRRTCVNALISNIAKGPSR